MQAASRARFGQSPPARSAIAKSGRQLSAARSFKASGIWGSGSASLAKLSAAHRAAFWRSSVVALAQAFNLGAPRLALQRQHRGAILERVGKLANRGDGSWSPGRKPAGLMLTIDFDVADDVGGGLGMPGIEKD